ncbi:MAG: methyl-accepting chemotaxis protein [Spirochaetota bacterium]
MNFSLRSSLRNKLLLSFLLLSFLPTLFIGIQTQLYTRNEQQEMLFAELEEINYTKAEQITTLIQQRFKTAQNLGLEIAVHFNLQKLRQSLGIDAGGAEESETYAAMVARDEQSLLRDAEAKGFSDILILTRERGQVVYSSRLGDKAAGKQIGQTGEQYDFAFELWEQVKRYQRPILADANTPPGSASIQIPIGIPIYDADGGFTNVLVVTFPRQELDQIVNLDYGRYDTRESYLISSDFTVITNSEGTSETRPPGEVYKPDYLAQVLDSQSFQGTVLNETIGESQILASTTIDLEEALGIQTDFSWHIVTELSRAEFLAPARRSAWITAAVVLIVTIAAITVGFFIVRQIVTPISELNKDVSRLAEGYLDFHTTVERRDEIGSLLKNTEYMVTQIRKMVTSIRDTANRINEAGSTITSSVEQQSAISVEQAGSITEISSTMDEFASSFNQVSENVESVSQKAESISQNSTESSGHIDAVAEKMRDIHADNEKNISNIMELKKHSNDISKVMDMIHDISDQTKIIAFNAALEASSAGEAGKRFGVVAAEIRKLTESVIASTSSIDSIVTEIQTLADQMVLASEKTTKNIEKGLSFSSDSVENFDAIVQNIKASTESTKQIVLSVQQQKSAASQIQSGLKELSTGAQQNSEAIQEINKSGSSFKQISRQLSRLLSQFKLEENDQDKQ